MTFLLLHPHRLRMLSYYATQSPSWLTGLNSKFSREPTLFNNASKKPLTSLRNVTQYTTNAIAHQVKLSKCATVVKSSLPILRPLHLWSTAESSSKQQLYYPKCTPRLAPEVERWTVANGRARAESIHASFNSMKQTYRSTPNEVDRLEYITREHHLKVAASLVAAVPPPAKRPRRQRTVLALYHTSCIHA